jgi:4'-phosphopantetheinyl transferase
VDVWWGSGDRSNSRTALASVLAVYLSMDPELIPLVFREGLPPVVQGAGLHLSVAHSGGHLAVAVARRPVGIDVQHWDDRSAEPLLLRRTCTAREYRHLAAQDGPAREASFRRLWVRKEAVSKAVGSGLALEFGTLDVRRQRVQVAGRTWRIRDLAAPAPGCTVAVALRGVGMRVPSINSIP